MIEENVIRKKLEEIHKGDIQQLKVIFSESTRIIVEAPAGYGKTTTMVSRIAYLYAMGRIPNPKKMLGLTFSVNAALKIKRDVAEKLPEMLGGKNNPITINDNINVTNYHGFCKSVLKKYGYKVNPYLKKDPNLFKAIGEYEIQNDHDIKNLLLNEEMAYLLKIEEKIKKSVIPKKEEIDKYNSIIYQKLLSKDVITHTGIILMVLQIFDCCPAIQAFYSSYYPLIIVDEFQDTNCIAWELLKRIIKENTQLMFLGDSLQRIYGFIGALPNIMTLAKKEFRMEEIQLNKNYRFMNNPEMLKLDANIRSNAKTQFQDRLIETANVQTIFMKTHEGEAKSIVKAIKKIRQSEALSKISVLFRGRGMDVQLLQKELETEDIPYFYGMFKDDDEEYIKFHTICQSSFIRTFGNKKTISNRSLQKFIDEIEKSYTDKATPITQSLLVLLDAMISKVKTDYKELLPEEKYELILDTFENRQLKQAMEYVDANVILSTVHGSKGLEWNYVIIADVERWIFPSFQVCNNCSNKFIKDGYKCSLPSWFSEKWLNSMLDELSVFYVAVTRARIQVYLSASLTRYNTCGDLKNSKVSCFGELPGIKLVKAKFD